jgi:DNA-binding SARP family transcriptional activator
MIKISLFGGFRVCQANSQVEIKMNRSEQRLLAYLLLKRNRIVSRGKLYGTLWADRSEENARNCLKTALSRLRMALGEPWGGKESYIVTSRAGEVGFNMKSDHWLDVAIFEEQIGRVTMKTVEAMEPDDAVRLENVLRLYIGELLEGTYNDWVFFERERLHDLHLKGMEQMLRYKNRLRAFEEAASWGRRILLYDPLRENIHRELMQIYSERGEGGLAIRQYANCREIMEEQLGNSPSKETDTLYYEIMKRHPSRLSGRLPFPSLPGPNPGGSRRPQEFGPHFEIVPTLGGLPTPDLPGAKGNIEFVIVELTRTYKKGHSSVSRQPAQ